MLSSKTFALTAAFIAAALINRSLGPSLRGVYAEMQTWVTLFTILFGLSIDTAIYHFSNRSVYGANDKERFVTISIMSILYGCLGGIALTLFVVLWPGQVSHETLKHLYFLDGLLILTMLVGNLTIFLQALGHLRYSALVGCIQGLVNMGMIGSAYLAQKIDIEFVLCTLLIVQGMTLLILLFKFTKEGLITGRFSKSLAWGILAAGLKQHVATVGTFLYTKINQLLVFRFCGEANAGIFAVSLSAAFYLMFIPMTFQTTLYPRVIHGADEYEITIRSLRLGFYLWGGIIMVMLLFAKPILLIYAGNEFSDSISSFRVLMVAAWFLPLSSLVAPYYIKRGAFGLASLSAICLGFISIGLNIYLVRKYALIGASSATALSCLIGFWMVLVFLGYLSKKNPLSMFCPDFKNELTWLKRSILRGSR
jgi:O-antigen/teichoic acid export membrane protein